MSSFARYFKDIVLNNNGNTPLDYAVRGVFDVC